MQNLLVTASYSLLKVLLSDHIQRDIDFSLLNQFIPLLPIVPQKERLAKILILI